MKNSLSRFVLITPATALPLFGAGVSLLLGQMFSALVWGALYVLLVVRAERS